jgi:hypothetical protein
VDIEQIRSRFWQGQFSFYFHALQEALKDGLMGDDLLHVIYHGEIIERYPERNRCLLCATLPSGMPVHVVIDYSRKDDLQVVTTYVPDRREWDGYRRRRG